MATIATTVLSPVGLTTTGTTAGQAAGWVDAAASGGDKIPLTGRGTILRMRTSGTACDVTINSVVPSSYGTDVNLVVSLGATDEKEVFILNDGRHDLGGADKGRASLSYSAPDDLQIAVKIVSG